MCEYIAVDTGGTFTDLVSYNVDTGKISFTKSLTTHDAPVRGVLDCLRKASVGVESAASFKLGTTLVINTLLEQSGPNVALVTTRGFRDVLELGRGNRTEPFNLQFQRPPAFARRQARFEVAERIGGDGDVIEAPPREQVEEIARRIREANISTVAVSFINGYANPVHERLVGAWLREMLPDCFVTCATELSRQWYEFERTSTAVANAYTGPVMTRYVQAMESSLQELGFKGQTLVMGSNGGVLSPMRAAQAPVALVESGPIGGCIGAARYADALGLEDVIAFDMGGTTAKAAVIRRSEYEVLTTYYVGGYGKGIPIQTPVVDIVEVGAGGGSIAWLDEQQQLHVGPRSAGSRPGPIAYGRGGKDLTVTDANLVLGRLNPAAFQGGEMRLDTDAVQRAMIAMAHKLSLPPDGAERAMANGILAIAAVTMGEAIKKVTVERGKDPGKFVMIAYGGGGPLHGVEIAREVGIRRVVVPPQAGNFAAIGMLLADVRREESRTEVAPLNTDSLQSVSRVWAELEQSLAASVIGDFGNVDIVMRRRAEMRYEGQMHTVQVEIESRDAAAIRRAFDQVYLERYGHEMPSASVEFVSVQVVAKAVTKMPTLDELFRRDRMSESPRASERLVCFSGRAELIKTAVYQRDDLPPGFHANGPLVVEEYGSTTIVGPTDSIEVGQFGEIHVRLDHHFSN